MERSGESLEVEKEFEIPLPAKGECDASFDRKTRIPRATRTLIFAAGVTGNRNRGAEASLCLNHGVSSH